MFSWEEVHWALRATAHVHVTVLLKVSEIGLRNSFEVQTTTCMVAAATTFCTPRGPIRLYFFNDWIIRSLIHINGPFVLNNYVIFATIQRFSQPSVQSLSYPWRRARWVLMCAHTISSDTPFHLSSACLSFSIALIGPLNWIPVQFFHFYAVLCLCTLPYLSHSRPTSFSICLNFSAFSVCAHSAFVTLKGWHFRRLAIVRLCHEVQMIWQQNTFSTHCVR